MISVLSSFPPNPSHHSVLYSEPKHAAAAAAAAAAPPSFPYYSPSGHVHLRSEQSFSLTTTSGGNKRTFLKTQRCYETTNTTLLLLLTRISEDVGKLSTSGGCMMLFKYTHIKTYFLFPPFPRLLPTTHCCWPGRHGTNVYERGAKKHTFKSVTDRSIENTVTG